MIKNIIFFLLLFILQNLYSQVTFVVNNTSKNTSICISGDFEGWTGGKEKYRLKSIDHKYFITIPATTKTI